MACDQKSAEPVLTPQWLDPFPGFEEDDSAENRRQAVGQWLAAPPLRKPLFLVPLVVTEQAEGIFVAPCRDNGDRLACRRFPCVDIEQLLRAGKKRIDLGHLRN